jgi:hypothetical protein
MNVRSLTAVLFSAAAVIAVANAQDTGSTATTGMITLVDMLDEAADGEYYCADAFGDTVEEGDAIQAHTCKDRPGGISEDEEFTVNSPNLGQIETTQAPGFCVQAQRVAAGAWLNVLPCATRRVDNRQQWIAGTDGLIHPASDETLCWAVTRGPHGSCGNPDCSNYKRNLQLQTCSDYERGMDYRFVTWAYPGGSIGM